MERHWQYYILYIRTRVEILGFRPVSSVEKSKWHAQCSRCNEAPLVRHDSFSFEPFGWPMREEKRKKEKGKRDRGKGERGKM